MMLPMQPEDLGPIIRDRQATMRDRRRPASASRIPVRVRVGRALIAAGTALGGERAERPARPTPLERSPRAAG